MAVEIIAIVGAADANSFIDADYMSLYAESRAGGKIWTAKDSQLYALVESTRDLNVLDWAGTRATTLQRLAWGRTGVLDPDTVGAVGDLYQPLGGSPGYGYFAPDVIPERLKIGQAELTLQYLLLGDLELADQGAAAGVVEETIGPITTKWSAPGNSSGAKRGWERFPRVVENISPLLKTYSGAGNVRLRRV